MDSPIFKVYQRLEQEFSGGTDHDQELLNLYEMILQEQYKVELVRVVKQSPQASS